MCEMIKENIYRRLKSVFGDESFHIICIAITGSKAYGIAQPDSDTDVMGIFLPPERFLLGVDHVEQILLDKKELGVEGAMFSFSKWYNLMLQQNPNVLELLWHEQNNYVFCDEDYWPILLAERGNFLSKKLKHSYGGYAYAQMQRLKKLNENVNQNKARLENIEKFGYDVKAAGHVFRLLNTALDALVEHEITVLRPERHFILAIREGKYTLDELQRMSNDKIALIENAYIKSTLRNKVDMVHAKEIELQIIKHRIKELWKSE